MPVSILLPTYNRAYCLPRTIDSLLAQTYPDWELIIVDDGSTDDTGAVLARFDDPRIRVLRHPSNRGVAAARNTGLAAARNPLIAFCDSDDPWRPEKLAKQVDFLLKHPEVHAVFTDLTWRRGTEENRSVVHSLPVFSAWLKLHSPGAGGGIVSNRTLYLCLLRELPVKIPTLVIRREVFEQVGVFNEKMPAGSDWEFLIRAARRHTFAFLDEVLVDVNLLGDSVHLRFVQQDKDGLVAALHREARAASHDPEVRAAARRGIIRLRKDLYWHHAAAGRRLDALRACFTGFRETLDPGLLARAFWILLPRAVRSLRRLPGNHPEPFRRTAGI